MTLNHVFDHMKLTICRTFHSKPTEYTFFSSAQETFSWIDHILEHKTNLSKFKTIEMISSIFSEPNSMKLEINDRKINEKKFTTWRLNMPLKNQWVNEGNQ